MAESSRRSIAELSDLAIISANIDYRGTLPGAVTFGAEHTGEVEVLMRFEPIWRDQPKVEQAFLLFEPASGARTSPAPTPVEVWRIDESWDKRDLSWLAQPGLTLPKSRGIASANASPLRLDVTQLVNYARLHPKQDHGMAIRAPARDGNGVSYATGVAGGAPPRIEVYSR